MLNKIVFRYVTRSHGYVRVRLDDGRIVLEHRALMENFIERRLATKEVVHHKDGDPFNNALDNLEILSPSAHSLKHVKFSRSNVECATCGGLFVRTNAYLRSKKKAGQLQFYCSRVCAWRAQRVKNDASGTRLLAHGKRSTYRYFRCRCSKCTEAQRGYQREYRRRRKGSVAQG